MKDNESSSKVLLSVQAVEGVPVRGVLKLRKLLHGCYGLLLEIHLTRGSIVPPHKHGHESICYLMSGKVRLSTDNTYQIIFPGCGWINPEGEIHSTHALEDSIWLEFKAPPKEPFD